MYYDEELLFSEDYRRNRRRRNNDFDVECECNLVGSDTDRNPDCGCGGRVDPVREEKHVYHHVIHEEDERRKKPVEASRHESVCGKKGCICNQLKNMNINTGVLVLLEGSPIPIPGTFVAFDQKTCCATFTILPTVAPPLLAGTLVVDCDKISGLIMISIGG